MTRPFLPPPNEVRCCAIEYRAGWTWTGQRCVQRRAGKSDLCAKHRDMEAARQLVVRVSPPKGVA